MPDRDNDLTHLFVRDLDDIELPARDRWRPSARKESNLMKTSRYVMYAGAAAAVLVLALIASFTLRGANPVAAPQTASPTASLSPSATTTPSASAVTQPTSAAAGGTLSGGLGFPSDFIPPLTIYAISVSDPSVWFSVETPYFGDHPTPGLRTAAPGQPREYTMTGVAPGTYYVLGYFDTRYFQTLPAGSGDKPGVYSRFTIECIQATLASGSPPAVCGAQPADHSLVPVTVRAGQTVNGIDIKDWYDVQGSYPPRPTPR